MNLLAMIKREVRMRRMARAFKVDLGVIRYTVGGEEETLRCLEDVDAILKRYPDLPHEGEVEGE